MTAQERQVVCKKGTATVRWVDAQDDGAAMPLAWHLPGILSDHLPCTVCPSPRRRARLSQWTWEEAVMRVWMSSRRRRCLPADELLPSHAVKRGKLASPGCKPRRTRGPRMYAQGVTLPRAAGGEGGGVMSWGGRGMGGGGHVTERRSNLDCHQPLLDPHRRRA